MTSQWRHEYPYDTNHGVVINRAKFDGCTCSTFRGYKTDTQTDRIALYTVQYTRVGRKSRTKTFKTILII